MIRLGLIFAMLTLSATVLVSGAASTIFRSTAAAMTASYVTLLTICMGPLLVWLGRDAPWGYATVDAVLRIDPVAAALQASSTPGFAEYDLLPMNWWIIGSACLVLLLFIALRTRQYAAYQRKWMRRIPGLVSVRGDRPALETAREILDLAGRREPLSARRAD